MVIELPIWINDFLYTSIFHPDRSIFLDPMFSRSFFVFLWVHENNYENGNRKRWFLNCFPFSSPVRSQLPGQAAPNRRRKHRRSQAASSQLTAARAARTVNKPAASSICSRWELVSSPNPPPFCSSTFKLDVEGMGLDPCAGRGW
jgi:hypothetical protein